MPEDLDGERYWPRMGGPASRKPAVALAHPELTYLWQMALRAAAGDALCLVELRGFEPLTPCMRGIVKFCGSPVRA